MASKYDDNFLQTIWEFLPGILKFFAVVGIISTIFAYFNITSAKSGVDLDKGSFNIPIQRKYNQAVGKDDANVKLVYFIDYQCPACRGNQPIMAQIKPQYSERIQFVYKNFPLEAIHIYAENLARGAQAARRQGKFIEYNDKVFDLQDGNRYSSDSLESLAREIGLDVNQWNIDRNSNEINQEVQNDLKDLQEVELPPNSNGVTKARNTLSTSDQGGLGTPTSILYKGGKVVDWWTGGLPSDQLKVKLDQAVN